MSIYATNYIVDETTGETKLVKHLNKARIDRGLSYSSGWNKSGIKGRRRKKYNKGTSKLSIRLDVEKRILNPDLDLPNSYKRRFGIVIK